MISRTTRRLPLAAIVVVGSLSLGARCGGELTPVDEDVSTTGFFDDFDGPAGSSPSATYWTFDVGRGPQGDGWGNGQLEYDTARPENASLDGAGHLVITARAESFQGASYTSARMLTKGRFTQQYGTFAARIKLPAGRGLWPAFWMLGSDIDRKGWPACGEIDVMEARGQEPGVVVASLHGPGYSGGAALTKRYTLPNGGRIDGDFHVYEVRWSADAIAFSVDGDTFQTLTPASTTKPWAFDHPFFVLLNLAVGGSFLGAPDATTTFPAQMIVDWVRVTPLGP